MNRENKKNKAKLNLHKANREGCARFITVVAGGVNVCAADERRGLVSLKRK